MNKSRVFLNTWKAYNNGCVGYGWMTPEEAENFINENPERDGGEWFVADIDTLNDHEFSKLNYIDVLTVINTLNILDNADGSSEYNYLYQDEIVAIMECECTDSAEEALSKAGNYYAYPDAESYFEGMDSILELPEDSILSRYFDYDAYHRDLMFGCYEASNGVILVY